MPMGSIVPLLRAIGRGAAHVGQPPIRRFLHFLVLAWPGAALGLALAAILIPAYGGFCMGTGLGTIFDVGGALLLGTVVLTLSTLVVLLALAGLRRIPLRFLAVVLVTLGCLVGIGKSLGFSPDFTLHLGGPPILLFATAGAGVSVVLRRGSGRAGIVHAVIGTVMALAAVTVATMLVVWLAGSGDDSSREAFVPILGDNVVPLDAPNPAEPGPYEIVTLFYGSGTDRHRPEYGENVDIVTDSVDASPFLSNRSDFKTWARKKYWGFEPENLPLNARVWLPKGEGPFPLVLIVHGNHKMEEFSDPGYAYLGELFASRGFITASIDENFLNSSWSGDLSDENDARGWLLLKHLGLWRDWNEQQDHPLCGKVDLENIALIGHSRGGEAILHAAAFNRLAYYPDDANVRFDFGFSIKTLIGIAPIDGQYEPAGRPVPLENVNYLVLQGGQDSDVDFFAGARSYRRVAFTNGNYWMKTTLYAHRANHGQFNTVWGPYDAGPPLSLLLNRGALLCPEDQQLIAQVYISAFLEATLHGHDEYVPMFRDYRRAADWLPDTIYFNRFEDSDFRVVADFDDSIDVTRTSLPGGSLQGTHLSVWRQQEMKGRGDWPFRDYAVVLGWNTTEEPDDSSNVPAYTITLPETLSDNWRLDEHTLLSFCLADTGEQCDPLAACDPAAVQARNGNEANEPAVVPDADAAADGTGIDLTLELVTSDGCRAQLPLSRVSPLQPAVGVTFTKWSYWERARDKHAIEPVLQTFEFPLADFIASRPDFEPRKLRVIRFRFDRTPSRAIFLDQVGFVFHRDSAP